MYSPQYLNLCDHPPTPDSKIQYQITGGNNDVVFDIDSDTGMVRVKNELDFERVNKVRLADSGGFPRLWRGAVRPHARL